MAWVTYRDSERGEERLTLEEVADQFAMTVSEQWTREAAIRRLNDPYPLPVSWMAAHPSLSVGWDELTRLATTGAGWPEPPSPGTWAVGPRELAGVDNNLIDVFAQVPTGRLVILGEPGAGKTMLMVRLVLDLLARRSAGGPVPVLVAIASWDPTQQELHEWLEARLALDYPALAVADSNGNGTASRIRLMLSKGMIVPIIDGLDEIPDAVRGTAIIKINGALRPGESLLVTSRTTEYQDTVLRPKGRRAHLSGAAAIALRPLDAADVSAYLTADTGGDDRWNPVLKKLGASPGLRCALSTPLAVTLARTIYNPLTNKQSVALPDPSELCDKSRFPTRESIESYLFDAFIEAAYRPDPSQAADAERWLRFLACYLERRNTYNLAWWELRYVTRVPLIPLAVGVITAITTGIAAASGTHVGVGIGIGLGAGMLLGLTVALTIRFISNFKGGPMRGLAGGLAGAVIGGLAAGLARKLGIGDDPSAFSALPDAFGIGLATGASSSFAGGFAAGLVGTLTAGLLEGVGLGLPAGIVNGMGVGLAVGLVAGFVGRRDPAPHPQWKPGGLVGGLAIGLGTGLIIGVEEGPVPGLLAGTVIGVLSSWPCGLTGNQTDLAAIPSPGAALMRDGRTLRITALASGLAATVASFLAAGLTSVREVKAPLNMSTMFTDGLGIGLASGLIVSLTFGVYHSASPSFVITRLWLALRRQLPWRLMDFIIDAHERRGVLRQTGAFYQFRHAELQRHLARPDSRRRARPVGLNRVQRGSSGSRGVLERGR